MSEISLNVLLIMALVSKCVLLIFQRPLTIGVNLDEKVRGAYPFISFALPFSLFPLSTPEAGVVPRKFVAFSFAVGEF